MFQFHKLNTLADACVRQVGCHHFTSGQGNFIVWCLIIMAAIYVLRKIFK